MDIPSQLARVIDWPVKVVHASDLGHLGSTASPDSGDDAPEATERRVIDNPSAVIILVDLLNLGIESGSLLEAVAFPELSDLTEDLLAIGVPAVPLDGGMEAVH